MFRTLWAMAKTYLTVKAVEMIANAFRHPRPRKASAKASKRTALGQRRATH